MSELKTTIQIPSLADAATISLVEKDNSTAYSSLSIETICLVNNESEIMVSVEANPYNSMKGKYILYAVDTSSREAEISPKLTRNSEKEAEIQPQIIAWHDLETYINVVYDGYKDIFIEIHPFVHENVFAEIEVPPHNKMTAIYEVQQPPILTEIRTPTKDAFTRENSQYAAINYGFTTSMAVGVTDNDIWRSYIEYDLNNFPRNYRIVSTIMRLHYKGTLNKNVMLEISDLKESWQEYSITNLNRPTPLSMITDIYEINHKEKYIEFEITQPIEQWLHGDKTNNGFVIRLINETQHTNASFYTRESHKPPQLIIRYFDDRIYSFGRADVSTVVNVVIAANSDKFVIVEPTSLFSVLEAPIEFQCRVKGEYLYENIGVEITSSTPDRLVELSSRRSGTLEERAEIGVIGYGNNDKYAEVTLSKENLHTELFVRYQSNKNVEVFALYRSEVFAEIEVTRKECLVEVTAAAVTQKDVETELLVNKAFIDAEVFAVCIDSKDIKIELDVFPYPKTDKPTTIEVSQPKIFAEISVRRSSTLGIRTEIEVTHDTKYAEVFAKYHDSLLVEITPNIKNDVKTAIDVTVPNIIVSVVVRQKDNSDKETEVTVQQISDTDVEFFIRYTDDLDIEVDVRMISDTLAEITSNTPTRLSEITVPYLAESDMWAVVYPKIYAVNDMPAMIFVGSGNGAYAFII